MIIIMMMMMTPTMMIKMTTMMMVMMITLTKLSGTILRACSLLISLRADPNRSDHMATGIAKTRVQCSAVGQLK